MKSMYKSELARAAGVSESTFRRWTTSQKSKLAELGNAPRCKMLNPAAVKFLCDFYCIDLL